MINFVSIPERFAPANNPIVFKLSGSSAGLLFFKTELVEATTLATIYTGNVYPTPVNPTVASINLTNQLSALVRSDGDNNDSFIATGKSRNLIQYKIKATEYGLSGGSLVALSSAYTPTYTISGRTFDTFYAYEAALNVPMYGNYTTRDYVLYSGTTSASTSLPSFLTSQPDYKEVNYDSFEQLYFLQDIQFTGITYPIIYDTGSTNNFKAALKVRVTHPTSSGTIGTDSFIITNEVLNNNNHPATFSQALLTITGTCNVGDNISISASTGTTGFLLGAYTAGTSADTTTQIAAKVAGMISGNSYGFMVKVTGNTIGISSSGNTVGITSGTTSNYPNVSLLSRLVTTGTTGTTGSTAEVLAKVTFAGYAGPSAGDSVTVDVVDSFYGSVNLITYTVLTGDTPIGVFSQNLVNYINAHNSYGYFAARNNSSSFSISARTGTGAAMNGNSAVYSYNGTPQLSTVFSGGVTGTSGGTPPATYKLVPSTITQFTGASNATTGITITSGASLSTMYSVQVSPKKLAEYIPDMAYLTDGNQYSITITDAIDNPLSETRNYMFREPDCNVCFINVLYVNSLGGIDSIQLVAPQETVYLTKLNLKKNNLNLDNDNPYITNGVYNPTDSVYASNLKTNIKAYTKELSDEEAVHLIELVKSKELWFETSYGNLVPLTLVNTSYNVQQKKYMVNQPNQYQFEFSLPDNWYE